MFTFQTIPYEVRATMCIVYCELCVCVNVCVLYSVYVCGCAYRLIRENITGFVIGKRSTADGWSRRLSCSRAGADHETFRNTLWGLPTLSHNNYNILCLCILCSALGRWYRIVIWVIPDALTVNVVIINVLIIFEPITPDEMNKI